MTKRKVEGLGSIHEGDRRVEVYFAGGPFEPGRVGFLFQGGFFIGTITSDSTSHLLDHVYPWLKGTP